MVDAPDLKSGGGIPPVPVQVWPRANLFKPFNTNGFFILNNPGRQLIPPDMTGCNNKG